MKEIAKLLQHPNGVELSGSDASFADSLARKVEAYNSMRGSLTGYECEKCLNRGCTQMLRGESIVSVQCACIATRRSLRNIEKSGLKHLLQAHTFESYDAKHKWQVEAKSLAIKFVDDCAEKWFFIGGAIGSGKTHLCTAIVGELLKKGLSAKYMLWRNEIIPLKAVRNEPEAFGNALRDLLTVDVLYIDDFFKTGKTNNPTDSDVDIAFEILGYRYNANSVTIISSELLPESIDSINEAIGSRIYQRSKGYCIGLTHDKEKNYRYKQI